MILHPDLEYSYPHRRLRILYDELPPISEEWRLRAMNYHAAANMLPVHKFRSVLDYAATRREKAFWKGNTL